MTTKQIAELCGVNESTVLRWAKKASVKMPSIREKLAAAGHGTPALFALEEVIESVESGRGKTYANLLRNSSGGNMQPAGGNMLAASDIAAIVRETVASMVPLLIAAVRGAISEKAVATLPPAIEMSERAQLRQIISKAGKQSGDFAGTWGELYSQFYYRYSVNLRERAKNRGMDILDYAEAEGLLPDILSLAVSMFGSAA